jgi:PucR-like helix-turn-helix protein
MNALEPIQPRVAERIRADLHTIAAEMVSEVQVQIPEYARPLDPVYGRTVTLAVEEALRHFVGVLEHLDRTEDGWRDVFRAIGAGEMHEGRSLDTLNAALRLCARVGWRWLVEYAAAEGAPLHTLGMLAETIFSYLDQIADATAAGYVQAQAAVAGEVDRRRRRLLDLLVADPPASAEVIAAAADTARWRLPRRLAALAVDPALPGPPPVLPPDVLVHLDRAEPCLLVPEHAFGAVPAGWRGALGPTVPTAEAGRSLRWARQALGLARRGVLPGDGLVRCDEHLATLAVFRDEDLLALLAARRLAPLDRLRPGPRRLLADTLLTWLELDKNATEVAARLHVHPQTVRYRLRQLDRLFGAQLRDPGSRFELEIALRADRARRLSTDDN